MPGAPHFCPIETQLELNASDHRDACEPGRGFRRPNHVREVSGNELRWHFGPGLLSYRIALEDIEAVAVVRNHWWNGFGIRMRPGFRLYNVSGLDAVELHLRSNDIRRIGTDDPQGLAGALKLPARGGVIV